MKVINLQPHAVIFPDGSKIEPSGSIARVEENLVPVYNHPITRELGFPVVEQRLGDVFVGELPFPMQTKDTYFIVSLYVAQAMPYRRDLLIPVGQFRDDAGKIIGCQGLALCNPEVTREVMRDGGSPQESYFK